MNREARKLKKINNTVYDQINTLETIFDGRENFYIDIGIKCLHFYNNFVDKLCLKISSEKTYKNHCY